MGYTHYWTGAIDSTENREAMKKALPEVKKVIEYYKGVLSYDGTTGSEPLATYKEIIFNGKGDEEYEDFYFVLDDGDFSFCKTGHKEYDEAVCAVLYVLNKHLDSLTVTSDGFFGELGGEFKEEQKACDKWLAAVDNCNQHLYFSLKNSS